MNMKINLLLFGIGITFLMNTFSFAQTTRLRSSDCDIVDASVSTNLYASAVTNATQYRFRVDNGNQVQTLTKSVRSFSLNELGETLYNTEHFVEVSVEVGGSFGPFGTVCSVKSREYPCQIRSADCGRLLNDMDQDVYANVVGADEYYFEVTNLTTSSVDTITKTVRSFNLNDLPSPTFDTEYLVRVSVILDGVLQPFGSACSLFIDVDPNAPRILNEYCGQTFELLAYEYMKTFVPTGATEFEFRITNGPDQFSVQTTADSISFVDFVNLPTLHYAYNTTYDVDVRALVNGQWTDYGTSCQVSTTEYPYTEVQHLCGQTVTSFNEPISVYAIFSAPVYEFEITDLETGSIETITKTTANFGGAARRFKLNELSNYGYGKDYSIRSRVEFDGQFHPFGPSCIVSSPEAETQLRLADCGKNLSVMSEVVYADIVENATAYRFEVTNTTTQTTEIIDKSVRSFSLSELTDPQFNETYEVRVAAQYDGAYENYGAVCELYSPQVVLARLRSPDCGRQLILMNQAVYSNRADEDSYTFQFTNMSTMAVEEITKPTRDVRLSELTNPENGVEYQVRISVVRDGETLPFGQVCSILAPASAMMIANDDNIESMTMNEQDEYITQLETKLKNDEYSQETISMTAYPNPFSNDGFQIKFDSQINSNEHAEIIVTDVSGKIVYEDRGNLESLLQQKIGSNFRNGVYMVRLIQGDSIYRNKIIKR